MSNSKFSLRSQNAFTFLELILVLGISTLLLGFVTINLFRAQNTSSLTATINTLVGDLKTQQLKAMEKATEGRSAGDSYGIHFTNSSYVLFHGPTFNPNDLSNLTITIDPGISFTNITFPSSNVIFASVSGTFANFIANQNTIDIKNVSTTIKKTMTINKYGIVTGIQ